MSTITFLFLLSIFSALTGLVVEALKKMIHDKEHLSYNIMVVVVALIIGIVGTFLFYYLNGQTITIEIFIFAILMGLASALGSMVGYDKIKDTIEHFGKKG